MRFPCKVKNNSSPQIVTWADGTDEEIVAALEAHYNGDINLLDYWTIGDERTIHLSVSETEEYNDVVFVLSEIGGKYLADGVTECLFQVDTKSCATAKYNNSSVWSRGDLRTYCNETYYNSIPSTIRSIFKQFKNQTGNGSGSLNTTTDYLSLRAEIELLGVAGYSTPGEGTQVEYYKTASNRIKDCPYDIYFKKYWLRSPQARNGNSNKLCFSGDTGDVSTASGTTILGVAPFGVI